MTWVAVGTTVLGTAAQTYATGEASDQAAAGLDKDIEFQRESRDMARGDQASGRQAGNIALDAMMSMTGLTMPGGAATQFGAQEQGRQADEAYASGADGINMDDYLGVFRSQLGSKGKKRIDRYMAANPFQRGDDPQQYMDNYALTLDPKRSRWFGDYRQNNPQFQPQGANYGGPIYGRAYGGNIYSRAPGGATGGGVMYNVNETGPENVYGAGTMVRNPTPQTIQPSGDGYVQPNTDHKDPGRNFPSEPPGGEGGYQPPQENPGGVEGGYNFQTDPGYEFRIGEGQRAMERGAAASGGLLSGGYGRKLTRYAQDYASNEYSNVYNRISNIAGMGQVANQQSGGYAMQAGQGMGTSAAQAGATSAYGTQAAGNAWANAGNQLAQMDWGSVFNRKPSGGGVSAPAGGARY